MIPFAILSGKLICADSTLPVSDGVEIRVLNLWDKGFTFRLAKDSLAEKTISGAFSNSLSAENGLPEEWAIVLHFYHRNLSADSSGECTCGGDTLPKNGWGESVLQRNGYEEIVLREFSMSQDYADTKNENCSYYRVETEDGNFRRNARLLMQEYTRYIRLKTEESDAVLSRELVGYPAEKDEIFPTDFGSQKRGLLAEAVRSASALKYGQEGTKAAKSASAWERGFELAIGIDRPELCKKFLEKPLEEFIEQYWMEQGLRGHPLTGHKVGMLYFGNQFCPFLFPWEQIVSLLERAYRSETVPVVVFSYMSEGRIDVVKKCLSKLADWCRRRETSLELVVNDWGMAALVRKEGYSCFRLTQGVLLQKRKKDVRLPYQKGDGRESLREPAGDAPFYREYLKQRYGMERISVEACGYSYRIGAKKACLHLPFYQMNTAEHCTLYAACANGARGRQSPVEHCPEYCRDSVFLYPKHLQMVGRYNSLFGYDERILADGSYLEEFLEQGVDRIVMELL